MESAETLTIERRLTPAQAERRARAREAARELATEGGYEGVTMQAVASRAGVTRMTLYRYFASKDHLLAELVADWGRELAGELESTELPGSTDAERVAAAFGHIVDAACRNAGLSAALVSALLSNDPAAGKTKVQLANVIGGYLTAALERAPEELDPSSAGVMAHVFFSVLINLCAGDIDRDSAVATLADAARFCFPT